MSTAPTPVWEVLNFTLTSRCRSCVVVNDGLVRDDVEPPPGKVENDFERDVVESRGVPFETAETGTGENCITRVKKSFGSWCKRMGTGVKSIPHLPFGAPRPVTTLKRRLVFLLILSAALPERAAVAGSQTDSSNSDTAGVDEDADHEFPRSWSEQSYFGKGEKIGEPSYDAVPKYPQEMDKIDYDIHSPTSVADQLAAEPDPVFAFTPSSSRTEILELPTPETILNSIHHPNPTVEEILEVTPGFMGSGSSANTSYHTPYDIIDKTPYHTRDNTYHHTVNNTPPNAIDKTPPNAIDKTPFHDTGQNEQLSPGATVDFTPQEPPWLPGTQNTLPASVGTSRHAHSMIGQAGFQPPEEKPVIYIAGLFPWSEDIPAGSVGRGVLPAVRIALEHVNNDTRINRKYTLKMAFNDTRCDMAVATRAFFDMMAESQTTTAMLFGDVCYNVTGPMSQIAHQWSMFQLSYADTNPMLSDRDEFPNFYRTVPSDSDFNPARLSLLRYFNWTTVGTLFQDAKLGEARHGYASNRFDSLVEKHRINISLVESFADDPETAIKNLKDQDVRIIVGNFDQNVARKVFCSARIHSMYGPKHQWIILGTYEEDWWKVKDDTITCSPAELNETIHGYLATDVLPLSTSDEVTESGRTAAEYLELYNQARGTEYSKYHGYAYDGVWVVAKALDRLLDDVNMSVEMFRGPMVGRVLNETSFIGVTGRVQFSNGDRIGSMTLLQMRYGQMVKVGEYHALTDTLDLSAGEPVMWRDGKPPVDRSIKIDELRHVSLPVYIGFVVMASLGITMAVLFLALNIRFRRHRYIKMSSPNMNNLIIIGCILCYMSIFLLGAEPGHKNRILFSYWCTARSWSLALGFTLSFGAMFGKTWRVHAIFTNIKLNKKVIKDYKLMLIVLVLVLLDAVILVTWQVVDPLDKATKRLSPEVYADFEIIPKIDYCTSNHMEIWLGSLYAYKGLLLAFGVFLAWETRHVSIPALNDSKYIGMSVYNVVIMCVCGAAVSFIIEDKPTQSFIIIGLFIIFCTTITLCLVFLPKIIQLKRNPKGDEQRVRATLKKSTKKSNKTESMQKEKIKSTMEENRRLRGFLEQKAMELEHLLDQLGDDVIKDDLGIQSSLLHKKVLELRGKDGSPGKLSIKSCSTLDVECSSYYSDNSATTTVYLPDDSPPTNSLLKNRFQNSKLYSEVIEMAGVRTSARKGSVTIPPPAEDEKDDDPFGGVYLGPSESSDDDSVQKESKQIALGERQPLMGGTSLRILPYKTGNAASSESVFDVTAGAQGNTQRRHVPRSLRLRRHSAPLEIWTITESCLEESPDTLHAKDTQPLVRDSPRLRSVCPENNAMTSPMTPSDATSSPRSSPVIVAACRVTDELPPCPAADRSEPGSAVTLPSVDASSSFNGPTSNVTTGRLTFKCDVVEMI